MKPIVVSAGLFGLALAAPLAGAQDTVPPGQVQPAPQQAQQEGPSQALVTAVDGLHITVLEDDQGGMASVEDDQGESALIAFLRPSAADAARNDPAISGMTIGTVPVLALLQAWDGRIVFGGGASEIEKANALSQEGQSFRAPVFMVMIDGQEAQVDLGTGHMTPVLLGYEDAEGLVAGLEGQGIDASTIKIRPLEFGAVLQRMNSMPAEQAHYRFFTHPETVALIQSEQPMPEETGPQ